jgi:hypothetical protein
MRIETKARRDSSFCELLAQSSDGVPTAALLVRLFGNRQSAEEIPDQICSPISLLNFEPFRATVRPNGLRDKQTAKVAEPMQNGTPANGVCKELVTNCSLAAKAEGPRRKQRF